MKTSVKTLKEYLPYIKNTLINKSLSQWIC